MECNMTTMQYTGFSGSATGLSLWQRFTRMLVRVPGIKTWGPFLVVIIFWELLALSGMFSTAFFIGPIQVAEAFVTLTWHGILPSYIEDSVLRLLVGAAYGLVIGLAFGLLVGLNKYVRKFTWPALLFFQAVGDIAWLPLLIVWFGFSLTSVVIVIVYTVTFPLVVSIVAGIDGVSEDMKRAAASLGAGKIGMLIYVIIPGALPSIASGIRTGLGYGWRALIAAEIIIGTSGVGFMMFDSRTQGEVSGVFVGMIVLGALWYATDSFFLAPMERATVERWGVVKDVGR